MLDENLPTFFIKTSSDTPLSNTIYLSQHGSELQPEYTLRRPDPKLPASQNRYGVALYDSYNPEVLYAEVLVEPEWTQPTLSQAEIRAQNGVPPPPVPIVPNNFTIQLYNPDQQVMVRQIAGTWNSSAYWEFEMPQNTFRIPSTSALDRSQSDPAASDITPKVTFKWRKDGKLSKDITCALAGKSTDGRKNKEPDIVVAMFKGGKDLTVYEPNMHRVDVEDAKGLEVVLILSAAVIKDIFFNASRDMFNISSPTTTTKRKNSGPIPTNGRTGNAPPTMTGAILPTPPRQNIPASQIPPQNPSRPQQQPASQPPPANARTQWEIDAETARLKALVEAEEKERARQERMEEKRIKKMLEAEEKEQRRRDAEVAKETERLRKQYGVTGVDIGPRVQFSSPAIPPRPQQQQPYQQSNSSYSRPQAMPQYQTAPHSRPTPVMRPQSTPSAQPASGPFNCSALNSFWGGPQRPTATSNSPYLQAPGHGTASSSGFFGLGGRHHENSSLLGVGANNGGKRMTKKRSVFF